MWEKFLDFKFTDIKILYEILSYSFIKIKNISSAKIVLDENESQIESTRDKIDLQNDFDKLVVVQKVDSSSYDESTEEDQDDEEVLQLKKTIAKYQNEIEILKNSREVSENERNQANLELTKLQNQLEIERTTRERKEIELIQEKARNAENQLIIEELRSTIHDLEINVHHLKMKTIQTSKK